MDVSFWHDRKRSSVVHLAVIFCIGIGAGVCVGLVFLFSDRSTGAPWIWSGFRSARVSDVTIAIDNGPTSDFIADSFAVAEDWDIDRKTRIILIPHHLVTAKEIASFLDSMDMPRRVYLLAPDHFDQGRSACTVSDANMVLSSGETMMGSVDLVEELESDVLLNSENPFIREISTGALLPYIVEAWPKADIVPVICRADASAKDRLAIADDLSGILQKDKHAVLVASVDFSHYLSAEVADFHDVLAEDVIRGLADLESDRVELDSPSVLGIILKVARELGLGDVQMHDHTNSLRILQSKLSNESTSHFFAGFSPGDIRDQQELTMLFVGDMMFDREVKNRMARASSDLYPFEKIVGEEGRFFEGQDLVIGNLEGPITPEYRAPEKTHDFAFDPAIANLLSTIGFDAVSQANNHTLDQGREGAEDSRQYLSDAGIVPIGDQVREDADVSVHRFDLRGQSVAVFAFNITDNAFERSQVELAFQQVKDTDYQVVFMHWGNEYEIGPSSVQKELAHWLIDQGADAVIGAHPHWMQGVEVYQNVPIVYSLGNFIFDQDWSVETRYGLTVGLTLSERGSSLHLFPIKIEKSEPELVFGEERQERLNRLAEISDADLAEGIRSGRLDLVDSR